MKLSKEKIRIIILAFIVTLVLLIFALQLMQMQVVHGEDYEALVEKGWMSQQIVKAARGEILDRNGRPMAANAIGRDVVIDQAFLEKGSTNAIILKLIDIMEEAGEEWIDNLPITDTAPFRFKEGYDDQIARLKSTLGVAEYATVEDVVYHLKEQYRLEEMNDEDFRKVAGVRYEMQRRGFDLTTPYTFATDIKIETVPKILERSFELAGVDVIESPIRQYVSGDIAPHIIGRTGAIWPEEYQELAGKGYLMNDVIGREGAEAAFEEYLRGKDGTRQIYLNSQDDVVDVVDEQLPVPGNTVVLTIDAQLQKVTQDAIAAQIKHLNETYQEGEGKEANAGAAAVVNCKTGEILALATYPSYNLATFQEDYQTLATDELYPMWNRALLGQYAPGSTFKPCVALGALNEGIITASDTVNCQGVYTFYQGYSPRCLDFHGNINVINALRHSCNIFFYDVGRRLGIDKIDGYAAMLGMGQPTGIELQEAVGQVSSPALKEARREKWQAGDVLQASIGQMETLLTPLQMANYAATLANNGKRMKLTIVKAIKSYSFDETIMEHEPEVVEVVDASPEAFATVREGMVAVSRIGSARATFGGDYPMNVASKTGTPETLAEPNSTFICYAPAEDPELAVAVVIEKGWHGYTGAPVAKAVFDQYFFSSGSKSSSSPEYDTLIQ
ncbi:penicillin-binding transpeptidase domain-containing protein [Youxingia wuxianensis]|uniref:Penicillin-binding protein n=1 Tax=Youxingia wuxianensis TaxID=2763678 RepID=A0A926ESY9_9FIRM|nr:penicillin-binding transpeptidase domain-containing protein [Youxingia wuxianensis]MBC8586042.1 penicillin-binding protein [Youxingia wuxianensis]